MEVAQNSESKRANVGTVHVVCDLAQWIFLILLAGVGSMPCCLQETRQEVAETGYIE